MDTKLSPGAPLATAGRILLVAHDLFYRQGIRATGIDHVIAESGVAKRTFYRHYPAKNDLILAFLEYRHRNFIAWLVDALARHGSTPRAIAPALQEWFKGDDFRGCAFINTVVEFGEALPAAFAISVDHKREMTAVIENLFPAKSKATAADARALAVAIDGAIVGVQFGESPDEVLKSLERLIEGVEATAKAARSRAKTKARNVQQDAWEGTAKMAAPEARVRQAEKEQFNETDFGGF
jgi:AcrR family transcriptional regulator